MSKPTIEQQIFDDVASLVARYEPIPDGAKTVAELQEKFPDLPLAPLHKWVNSMVKSGKWKKARRGNITYFWPAK